LVELIKVIEAPLDSNLHALSVYWWQQKIAHKIAEEAGKQVIWIETDQYQHQVIKN